jgi:hypothetical protein
MKVLTGKDFMKIDAYKEKRYHKTISFLKKVVPDGARILDLGTPNALSDIMATNGYRVYNTQGEDLDTDYHFVKEVEVDVVTSFEVFEHLLAPFNILREIKAPKLVASVPLRLWFANAYWNEKDDWDKHYHEFEEKQFNLLLQKTGWEIKASEKWTSSLPGKIGIRPILRHITPRYYIVYCEKKAVA